MKNLKKAIKDTIYKKECIHVKTLEEYYELEKIVKSLGINWFISIPKDRVENGNFCVYVHPNKVLWDPVEISKLNGYKIIEFSDLCKDECIVIYRKDNETIALDNRTGKKAVAKCCPEDTYNFEMGAELAFKRLMEIPKKPLNTKVIFIKSDNAEFTERKIYEIKDGNIIDNNGRMFPMLDRFYDMEDVKKYFGDKSTGGYKGCWYHTYKPSELIEVVE